MQRLVKCIKNVPTGVKNIGGKLKKWASNLFKPRVTPTKPTNQTNNINTAIDNSKNGNTTTINNTMYRDIFAILLVFIIIFTGVCFVFIYFMTK